MRFYLSLLASALFLASCAHPAQQQEERQEPEQSYQADNAAFNRWLAEFKQDARGQGISQKTLDEAFADTQPIAYVIELDRKQPETTLTFDQYRDKIVNAARVQKGRERLAEHRELLEQIGRQYGVQPRFIVALWGIETNYGGNMGSYSIVDALATLAYDGRRSSFFRGELINALKILDQDHFDAIDMQGSWAGAMGQCQFMPSSFHNFAVDYDRDGKRDIWNTQGDVFASIANYLKSSGWNASGGWGMAVSLPPGFDDDLENIDETRSVSEWQRLGVRTQSGGDLPPSDRKMSLVFADSTQGTNPHLIENNYKVLLKWNRSRYFATAVGMLADRIGE